MNQHTHTCFPLCQTSAWLGFKEMKPLLCTDLAAWWAKWFLGRWDSWSPLSIWRTGFRLITSHIAVTTRKAIPLLGALPTKKLKGYFWNKGAEAAELQGKTPINNPHLYRGKDPEKHWLPFFWKSLCKSGWAPFFSVVTLSAQCQHSRNNHRTNWHRDFQQDNCLKQKDK